MKPIKHHVTQAVSGRPPFTELELATLAHYESAARAECALMGEDPMQEVVTRHSTIKGVNTHLYLWETKVGQLEAFDVRMQALLCTAADRKRRDEALNASAASSSEASAPPSSATSAPSR